MVTKRRFLLWILIALVLAAAAFAWSVRNTYKRFQIASEEVQTMTADVEESYDEMAAMVEAISATSGSVAFESAKQAVIAARGDMQMDAPLGQRIASINALQTAIVTFVQQAEDAGLADDPAVAELRRDLGERSLLRPRLDAYNDSANRLNKLIQEKGESLSFGILGLDATELPFLRFDGTAQKEMKIDL